MSRPSSPRKNEHPIPEQQSSEEQLHRRTTPTRTLTVVKDDEGQEKEVSAATPMKRVSFYLPETLYADLAEFAEERGETMTGLVRWSLGLSKVIWEEAKAGHRIQVARDGKPIKEFVISAY